jgi:hypothetical protein
MHFCAVLPSLGLTRDVSFSVLQTEPLYAFHKCSMPAICPAYPILYMIILMFGLSLKWITQGEDEVRITLEKALTDMLDLHSSHLCSLPFSSMLILLETDTLFGVHCVAEIGDGWQSGQAVTEKRVWYMYRSGEVNCSVYWPVTEKWGNKIPGDQAPRNVAYCKLFIFLKVRNLPEVTSVCSFGCSEALDA